MKREDVACPLCGEREAEPWGTENGWHARRCKGCALVYVSPRPVASEISEAAKLGQHAVEDGVLDVVGRFSQKKVKGFGARLAELWPTEPPWSRGRLRWLDIGAGFGELVKAVSDLANGSHDIVGLEPCEPKVKRARALGIRLESRALSEMSETRWDVVSMINVLSHLPAPLDFLEQIHELLEPGGELLLVTGNGAEIERAQYPQALSLPDHLVFAGQAQLERFLEGAGFEVTHVTRFSTSMPRPAWEAGAEALAARLLRRRVGYSGTPFRSLWVRARRST